MAAQYETRLFINNKFVDAKSKDRLDVYNPADGNLVVSGVHVAGPEDVDAAVDAAQAAFEGWSTMSGQKRAACMLKFADLLEANAEKLGHLETVAMGAPKLLGGAMIGMATSIWRYYAGLADKIPGNSAGPAEDGLYKIIRYEPFGVCAGIGAWNGTAHAISIKLAPALAAGNTFVYKNSEKSPLGVLAWAALFAEAGFPAGVVNIISGAASTGSLMASHMKVRHISFTGSIAAGKKVQAAAATSNLKRVTLELGGKSPSLIFDDADMENVLTHTSQSFLANSSQACVAGSRVLVQETIADKYIEQLKGRFEMFKGTMGDPADGSTFLGPIVDRAQSDRVMSFIEDGKKHSPPVVGGNRSGKTGNWIEPTIFVNPPLDSKVFREEVFGPVLTVRTFKTEEEAIEIANDTEYGLSSQIYASDINRILRVATKLQAGNVGVNTFHNPNVWAPFGGSKQSGVGREAGMDGFLSYLEPKTIQINMNLGGSFAL